MEKAGSNRPEHPDFRLVEGLVFGALLSIPLWVCIGVGVAVMVQDGPISGLQVALLFFAAAAEIVLLGRSWRLDLRRFRPGTHVPNAGTAVAVLRLSRLKPLLLMTGLTVAYLHYYFWDIHLQIVAMPAITVFVHAPALG
jgi:hypothetical protein